MGRWDSRGCGGVVMMKTSFLQFLKMKRKLCALQSGLVYGLLTGHVVLMTVNVSRCGGGVGDCLNMLQELRVTQFYSCSSSI